MKNLTELDTLGKRLYYLRQSCNKTLQEVSDSSHISRSNLGKYEKDIVKPTADAIISLSNFYRISTDWILKGSGQNTKKNILMKNNAEIDTIGQRLKCLRRSLNLTQKKFAYIIGISQGNLSEMEKDKIFPSYNTLIFIMKQFKISADWILIGKPVLFSDEISEDPEIKEIHEIINKVMSDPDPEIRTWAKIQFHKAFADYFQD